MVFHRQLFLQSNLFIQSNCIFSFHSFTSIFSLASCFHFKTYRYRYESFSNAEIREYAYDGLYLVVYLGLE